MCRLEACHRSRHYTSGLSVHVVRIITPGLEGYMHYEYRPGRRAINYATEEV